MLPEISIKGKWVGQIHRRKYDNENSSHSDAIAGRDLQVRKGRRYLDARQGKERSLP